MGSSKSEGIHPLEDMNYYTTVNRLSSLLVIEVHDIGFQSSKGSQAFG